MLLFVIPRFAGMFEQLAVQPPASTLLLLSLGQALRDYWYGFLLGIAALIGASVWFLISAVGRQFVSNMQTRIPVIGRLRGQMIQAQALRTMGMLLDSRVGMLETFELARKSTENDEFQKLFNDMSETVTTGGQLSYALERCRLLEPYVVQAVRTGEESGNIAGAMIYCADVLDESNTELLQTVMKLIEPAILIVMGLVVGGVAISLFLPLFDLTSAVQ
jgi:type II secretory pathway component PulF